MTAFPICPAFFGCGAEAIEQRQRSNTAHDVANAVKSSIPRHGTVTYTDSFEQTPAPFVLEIKFGEASQ